MDIENLDAGQDFEELPDSYTIFITEHDVLGEGLPFYSVERVTLQTGQPFNDGSHILYSPSTMARISFTSMANIGMTQTLAGSCMISHAAIRAG